MTKRRLINCIFCGDQGVPESGEDVFPLWLQGKLGHYAKQRHPDIEPKYLNYSYNNLGAFQSDLATRSIGDQSVGRTVTGARPAVFKLPDVCTPCNGGWMSRLEETAKHLVVGFMEGKRKPLAPFDQLILSTWVVKTCLTLDASEEPRQIPSDVGSGRFFELGYPLPVSEVAVGYDPDHQPEGALLHSRMRVNANHLPTPALDGVIFAFQFESLVLSACINIVDDIPRDKAVGVALSVVPPYHERIWPPQGRFMWPSDTAIVRRHPERSSPSANGTDVPMGDVQGPGETSPLAP